MLRKGLLVKDERKETVFPPFYWSCFYHALRTVSENAYVKCGVLIIVASIGRDEVGVLIFLGDKVNIFSSRKTN